MKVFIGPYAETDDEERDVQVHIDNYDVWNMDHTLALIVAPMLKLLKEKKHGSPFVDDEDVPEAIRSTSAPPKEHDWETDEHFFKRWDYVLDEMIWAFETKCDNSADDQFYHAGGQIDLSGLAAFEQRMRNGFRLFGKYYQGLWD